MMKVTGIPSRVFSTNRCCISLRALTVAAPPSVGGGGEAAAQARDGRAERLVDSVGQARAAAGDGRTDARRVVDCALLYRITGNASWAAAGIAEVTSQANAKTT